MNWKELSGSPLSKGMEGEVAKNLTACGTLYVHPLGKTDLCENNPVLPPQRPDGKGGIYRLLKTPVSQNIGGIGIKYGNV